MMIFLIKCLWYLSTIIGAVFFIPFNLSFFSVWELLKIWPFVLTFFEVIILIMLGFNVPQWLTWILLTIGANKNVIREKAR